MFIRQTKHQALGGDVSCSTHLNVCCEMRGNYMGFMCGADQCGMGGKHTTLPTLLFEVAQ